MEIRSDQLLMCKTDSNGLITYVSPAMLSLSGYEESALLGQKHTLFHHHSMPAGFYRLMWQTLKQGKEFNGFVLNTSKSGDSYWTFSNMTPTKDMQGRPTGYNFVKRQANPAAVTLFSMYYEQMREIEQKYSGDEGARQSQQLLQDILSATGDSYEASVFKLQLS